MKSELSELLNSAIQQLIADGTLNSECTYKIVLQNTKDKAHGDLASNLAMMLAKLAGLSPRLLAEKIIAAVPDNTLIARTEIAGPGFINFFISENSVRDQLKLILDKGSEFGQSNIGNDELIQIEYVSANPTGPLHIGHGRGAVIGDCLSRLLTKVGFNVTREFYYNDAGKQIDNLALSVQARCKNLTPDDASWPDDGYQGEYIIDVAKSYLAQESVEASDTKTTASGDADNLTAIKEFAVAYLRREQDQDLKAFNVGFDRFFLESSLYESKEVDNVVSLLSDNGHTYEQDGALWLKTTDFGDDKDRVMRKKDGGYTYFVPDVAYHLNKWQRGFTTVINEQGADHHSTITRVRAGLQGLNKQIPQGWPEYVLHQMVTVMRGGYEVKISKRAGSYLTLRDLVEEVGVDATRFFLVARKPESQLVFDIDLALSQSNDNPVYYIQYAHARICSMFRKLTEQGLNWQVEEGLKHFSLLEQEQEQALIKKLNQYPSLLEQAAKNREPHQIATYLRELAGEFHSYYNAHKTLVDDVQLRDARLLLSSCTKQILANGLDLLGLSAPEEM